MGKDEITNEMQKKIWENARKVLNIIKQSEIKKTEEKGEQNNGKYNKPSM